MKKFRILCMALILSFILSGCLFEPKVESIQSCSFQEDEDTGDFSFFFGLCDGKGRYVARECTVSMKIVNDKGEKVYSGTFKVDDYNFVTYSKASGEERLLGKINIKRDEIAESASESGKVYFTITGKNFEFGEKECSVSKCLPYRVDVETLRGWTFQQNSGTDDYSLFFQFLDADGNEVAADCTVEISIYNTNAEKVYSGTRKLTEKDFGIYSNAIAGDRLMANIRIKNSNIVQGTSNSGTVYFTVTGDDFSFDEAKCEALYCLPVKDIVLVVDTLPVSVVQKNYGSANDVYNITEVKYTVNTSYSSPTMDITVSGEKTAGSGGSFSYGFIGFKLYDSEGYMVDSGTISLGNGLSKGDKFKADMNRIYDLVPGETYLLVLTDYSFY